MSHVLRYPLENMFCSNVEHGLANGGCAPLRWISYGLSQIDSNNPMHLLERHWGIGVVVRREEVTHWRNLCLAHLLVNEGTEDERHEELITTTARFKILDP